MRKKIIVFALAAALIPAWGNAQFRSDGRTIFKASDLVRRPAGLFDRLLHSSRFRMTQSYSLSFFSMGGQGFNQGMYLNSMSYQISDPLLAQLQIGYLHQPFGARGDAGPNGGKVFVRSASLLYKPSDQMSVHLDYETVPAYSLSPLSGIGLR
jgi:hypothetical protein